MLTSQPAPEPSTAGFLSRAGSHLGYCLPPSHTGKTQRWGLLLLLKSRNFTWRYFPHIYFPGLGDLQRSPGWRRVTGYPSLRNGEMSETCFPWNMVLDFERPQSSSVSAGHLSESPFILLYISGTPRNEVVLVGRSWYHCLHKGLRDSSPGNCCRLKAPWLWVCRPENGKGDQSLGSS